MDTPKSKVRCWIFKNQPEEISRTPLFLRELHWCKLTRGSGLQVSYRQVGNAGVLLFPAEPAYRNVCCCLWQTTVQEKSPGLRHGLSIRGHQKVISDFIRYQPTQLPLRAHIAVTPYGSHSFPCVSQSLWAQGHQLGERKIAWDPELDFCLGSDLAPRNMPTEWLQELYTQCSVTGGCPRKLYCSSRDQCGPANTPASQHQLWISAPTSAPHKFGYYLKASERQ